MAAGARRRSTVAAHAGEEPVVAASTPSHGLVTPEAVPLDLPIASVGSRGLAFLIDALILAFLTVALLVASFALEAPLSPLPPWVGVTLVVLLLLGVNLGYPTLFETFWQGRTPGKAAVGLRVVTVEGAPVRFRHAAIRAALGLVDFTITGGAAAVLSGLVTRRTQRLGDLVAGTLVLRERTGAGTATAARYQAPRGLEEHTAQLDVTALGPADYQALRAFLQRAGRLDDAVRRRLAEDLARTLVRRVRPAPPPGVAADAWLRAVAAAYQRRSAPTVAGTPGDPSPRAGGRDLERAPAPYWPEWPPPERGTPAGGEPRPADDPVEPAASAPSDEAPPDQGFAAPR